MATEPHLGKPLLCSIINGCVGAQEPCDGRQLAVKPIAVLADGQHCRLNVITIDATHVISVT